MKPFPRNPKNMTQPLNFLLQTIVTLLLIATISYARNQAHRNWTPPYESKTQITDFRYNSARIDGITRLFNDTLIVISNDHYWILDKGQLPRIHNVKGHIRQLYPGFKKIDDIWADPYNDVSPQIYLVSNSAKHGLRVVCQEFFEDFKDDSSFCHLPVDNAWRTALKDLDNNQSIDAVTWRNRTKNVDGGFWVFFQGHKMITVDPYEMNLRYTYDIREWMSINTSLTAAYYDYRSSIYHMFFDNNKYYTWTVDVPYMNKLPMKWDRAFLHGKLSPPMKINEDFFGFNKKDIRNWSQPYYDRTIEANTENDNSIGSRKSDNRRPVSDRTTRRPRVRTSTSSTMFDVEYVSPKIQFKLESGTNRKIQNGQIESESEFNSLEHEQNDIGYQKQLMKLESEQVLDFVPDASINSSPSLVPTIFSVLFLANLLI